MQGQIREYVAQVTSALGMPEVAFAVERPADMSHGDWACNVALVLSKQIGKNPKDVAQEVLEKLQEEKIPNIFKMEIAGPGFINFYCTREFFTDTLKTVLKNPDEFGGNPMLKGKTVMVEYGQPNVFKVFHIGHLMACTIGESLARIAHFSAAKVIRANYQGDVGLHVAKALWGIAKTGADPNDNEAIGAAYAYAGEKYETDEEAQKEIVEINKKIYAHDPSVMDVYEIGRKTSLDAFEKMYALLGTTYDAYFFESEVWETGLKLVEEGLVKGIFEKGEGGAIVFPGEKYGLHTRVFITKDGLPTYEAKDLGLALLKMEKYHFDWNITETAVEQEQYFEVVFKALSLLRPEFEGKLTHVHHGMMLLPTGKMSSRTGKVLAGKVLIDDMVARAKEKVSERGLENAGQIAEDVAIGAIKYMILKQGLGKNIVFDAEKSLSFEGDSGPYLQYTLTRAKSVLEKAKKENLVASCDGEVLDLSNLERLTERFPEKVAIASSQYSPNTITNYLIELSSEFNSWYAQEQIVNGQDPKSPYKISITQAVVTILENGLWTLGIPVPSKM